MGLHCQISKIARAIGHPAVFVFVGVAVSPGKSEKAFPVGCWTTCSSGKRSCCRLVNSVPVSTWIIESVFDSSTIEFISIDASQSTCFIDFFLVGARLTVEDFFEGDASPERG